VNGWFGHRHSYREPWDVTVSQSGTQASASSVSYDAAIPAHGSTSWGMVVNGNNQTLNNRACTLRT
jgi:Cellulose binding domain